MLGQWRNLTYQMCIRDRPEGDITDIVECREGILLVYNTGRLVCLDTRTKKIKWQQDDVAMELGTDKQGIFTLFVDRDNDIWTVSYTHLDYYSLLSFRGFERGWYGGGFHAYQGNGDGAFGSPEFE